VPTLENDRYLHTDIDIAIGLVRTGAVVRAASAVKLPGISEP
jgi:histidine ammonia-lyase